MSGITEADENFKKSPQLNGYLEDIAHNVFNDEEWIHSFLLSNSSIFYGNINQIKENIERTTENGSVHINDYVLPPEKDTGNIEYKRQLVGKTNDRLEHLCTQCKYRLSSQLLGIAWYLIGIDDSGIPIGLNDVNLWKSLNTLHQMTKTVNARIFTLRLRWINNPTHNIENVSEIQKYDARDNEFQDKKLWIVEVGIRSLSTTSLGKSLVASLSQSINYPKSIQNSDIRVPFIGESSAGKSTLLSVLFSHQLDSGHGTGRLKALRHRHEMLGDGRTSALNYRYGIWTENGKPWSAHIISSTREGSLNDRFDNDIIESQGNHLDKFKNHIKNGCDYETLCQHEETDWPFGMDDPDLFLNENSFQNISESSNLSSSNDIIDDIFIRQNIYGQKDESDPINSCPLLYIDTPGCDKYLGRTLQCLTLSILPSFVGLIIDGVCGDELSSVTRTFIKILLTTGLPFFVVLTKIDLLESSRIPHIFQLIEKSFIGSFKSLSLVQNESDLIKYLMKLDDHIIPVFSISNVTGQCIWLLRKYLFAMTCRKGRPLCNENKMSSVEDSNGKLLIEDIFSIPGSGTIIMGPIVEGLWEMIPSKLKDNSSYFGWLEKDGYGSLTPLSITSMHRYQIPMTKAYAGQYVALLLPKINRCQLTKGTYLHFSPDPKQVHVPQSPLIIFNDDLQILKTPDSSSISVMGKLILAIWEKTPNFSSNKKENVEQGFAVVNGKAKEPAKFHSLLDECNNEFQTLTFIFSSYFVNMYGLKPGDLIYFWNEQFQYFGTLV